MNNTYIRMVDLMVADQIEEGKKWDAAKKAGKIVLGGAALAAGAQFATQSFPRPSSAEQSLDRAGLAVKHIQSKTHGTEGQVEGQPKPVGGLSPHPRLSKFGVKVARPRHKYEK